MSNISIEADMQVYQKIKHLILVVILFYISTIQLHSQGSDNSYPIVDTGQDVTYDTLLESLFPIQVSHSTGRMLNMMEYNFLFRITVTEQLQI